MDSLRAGGVESGERSAMILRRPIRVVIINAYDEQEMYAEALRSRGLDVMTVASGAEGPAAVTRAQPDAFGQRMTFKDGPLVDLAVALENRLSALRTGLVMLSGFADSPTPIAIM
jgi:hypothetical protein